MLKRLYGEVDDFDEEVEAVFKSRQNYQSTPRELLRTRIE